MSTPYVSEIRIVSFDFPPKGWALCNGQTLSISQNQALFSLLGTTYGGNGQTTFMLPNLQGRLPISSGSGYTLGMQGGEAVHTLSIGELPTHDHALTASTALGNRSSGSGNLPAAAHGAYAPGPDTHLTPASVSNVGGSQPHQNLPPILVLNFIIALQGVFPSRN